MGASGQLGHGDTTDQLSPKRVISESLEVERVVQIAAGDCHSLLLTESGQVFTFGSGSEGQLGHGDKMNYLSPTKINSQTLENQQIIQVAAGQMHTLLLNAEGHVFTFGNGFFGQLGHGKNESVLSPKVLSWETLSDRRIVQVSAGATHSLLLTQEGEVLTFGQGETLQIGNVNVDVQARPKSIPSKALEGQRVIQVSSGHTFSLLLTEKGELLLLGTGDDEQFSQDETPDSGSIPRPVKKGWFWLPEDFGLFSEDKKVQRDT
jgi:alpha-tubulin suppressor-like RCC1 family protein